MAIPYTNIAQAVRSDLDAEIGNYYDDTLDIIPALNLAQDTILTAINAKIGAKKFMTEFSRSLIQNRIWQTSNYSRVLLDVSSSTVNILVWSIISVIVNPNVAIPPNKPVAYVPITTPYSVYRPTYIYASGGSACKQLNSQEYISNAGNPLEAGFVSQNPTPQNVSYAYISHQDYMLPSVPSIPYEIEIRPFLPNAPVAITFVAYPNRIVNTTDILLWHPSAQAILVNGTLHNLAYKQGDKTTVWSISEEKLMELLTNMS